MELNARKFILLIVALVGVALLVEGAVTADFGDTTPPVSSLSCLPASPDGNNGWYISSLDCDLSADDLESGTKTIFWRLDDESWSFKNFPPSLNLVSNNSFEQGDELSSIDYWDSFGLADFYHDSTVYLEATHSASLTATVNGWSYWSNEDNYIVASPWQNMSASVWLRTQDIAGQGAYFKVFALTSSGQELLTESDYIVTAADWTRIAEDFLVSSADAYGIYLQLGLEGVGSVWFDAVTVKQVPEDTSASFVLSEEGEHTLEYYAVDHEDNEELPHQTFTYKLDSVPPGNWRDFDVFRIWGPEHELYSVITVSDATSGLQTQADAFQYSVDAGEHWGTYSNLRSCSSTWLEGNWYWAFTWPFWWSGVHDATLITPKIDYCNSNWAVCKIIRFKVIDVAGNEATTDVCINGAWVDFIDGAIGVMSNIEMSATGSGGYNTNGLVQAGGTYVSGLSSSEGWEIREYTMDAGWSYSDWDTHLQDKTPIEAVPSSDGIYIVNGDLTVLAGSLPPDIGTASFSSVVFVNGDMRIQTDMAIGNNSALTFIVNGDLEVKSEVTRADGFYLVEGNFNSSYNGGNNKPALQVNGGVIADSFLLPRSLSHYDNIEYPAEIFKFEPKYYELMRELLGGGVAVFWEEI